MKRHLPLIALVLYASVMSAQVAFAQEVAPVQPTLDAVAMWGIIVGFATSVVTSILNRSQWSSWIKLTGFFTMSIITSAGNAYFNGELDTHDWTKSFLIVFSSGITFYLATKPALKEIESKTG
jgi:hypothetical protein